MILPICDICNKYVDRIECEENVETESICFRVYCHGEFEETILTNQTIASAISISLGRVFKEKKILQKNKLVFDKEVMI